MEKIFYMKNKEKFFLVGCGKMGLPILKAILKVYPKNSVIAVSRDPLKLKKKLTSLTHNIQFSKRTKRTNGYFCFRLKKNCPITVLLIVL